MARRQTKTPALPPARPRRSMTRADAIDAILTAAEKPVPAIVPARRWLCSDGQWRNVHGVPHGVTMSDECRIIGYVFQAPDGITYGTIRPTESAQRDFWTEGRARDRAEFLAHLNESDNDRVASQASYWLKADVTIITEPPTEPPAADVTLRCDMDRSCDRPVTHIDAKGYVYCATHGRQRQTSTRCRQLQPSELKRLQAGQTLPRY